MMFLWCLGKTFVSFIEVKKASAKYITQIFYFCVLFNDVIFVQTS